MTNIKIEIRHAVADDSPIIARAVAMAIGDEQALHHYCGEKYLLVLQAIARAENTQYSWRSALIAEADGVVAGAVVGYDGALLEQLRANTFAIIEHHTTICPSIPNETEAGEYYLDSVAVLPQFRGLGIGRRLISALCEEAFGLGHERVGLIVEHDNKQAQALYSSLGFQCVGRRIFFGHQMWHMQLEKNFTRDKFAKSHSVE